MMVDAVPGDGARVYENFAMERPKTSQGRPKTGHGRRTDHGSIQAVEVPPPEPESSPIPRPTTSRANRPRTSHGRRPADQQQLMQQHQERYIQQEQEQEMQQQQQMQHQQQMQQSQDDYPYARPKTSHGRRRSSFQLQDSSSRAYMSPGLSPRESAQSPYRPPSSALSGRPMSGVSSLSRYSVLPSIGSKVPAQTTTPPSPPRLGERSVTMLNLKNDVQVMRLEDDGDENDNENANVQDFIETPSHSDVHATTRKNSVGHATPDTSLQREKSNASDKKSPTLQKENSTASSGGRPASEEAPPFRPLTRENTLSEEPTQEDEETVLLAVKLPDGQRVTRRFRRDETMAMVMHFAEVSSNLDFSGYDLVCDAPRKVYKDLEITVGESGLANRTVLHIRFPDE